MEFSLNRLDLLEPLSKVVGVLEKRQTLPILSHVLINVQRGQVVITGSDQEVQLEAVIDASVDSVEIVIEGVCAVPGRKLLDIVRHLPAESVLQFKQTDQHVVLLSGAFESQFSMLPAEDFPRFETSEVGVCRVGLPGTDLKAMLSKTMFAMAHQDVRYFFNGMLLELDGALLRLVATNGQRLATAEHALRSRVEVASRPVVPRKGVLELAKLLDDAVGELVILISDNALEAQFGCFRFTTKLIDGDYPDYNKAIPSGGDKVFECSRKQLRDALIRTSVMSNEVYKNVKLSLTSNRLTLFTNNPLLEQAEEVVEVSYAGEAIEIGFNVNFLIEALSVMDGERVHVELSGETSPCLMTDLQDTGAKFVVSPMII